MKNVPFRSMSSVSASDSAFGTCCRCKGRFFNDQLVKLSIKPTTKVVFQDRFCYPCFKVVASRIKSRL